MKENLWPFDFSANENPQTGIGFISEGTWKATHDSLAIELNEFNGHLKKRTFALVKPFALVVNPKQFSLSQALLKVDGSSIESQLDIDFTTMNVQGSSHWEKVPLEILKYLTPELALNGLMDGDIKVHGPVTAIQGTIEGNFKDVTLVEDTAAKFPLHGTILANLDDKGLNGQAKITGTSNRPMILEATLPISISLNPFLFHSDKEKPLYSHLVAHGKIAPFLEMFLTDKTSLDSDFNLDLAVSGTIIDPQISGHAELTQGYFESLNTGAVFKDLHAVIEASGRNCF